MNAKTASLTAALVALAAIALYLGSQLNQTQEQLTTLNARFEAAETDRADEAEVTATQLEVLARDLAANVDATAKLGTTERIADSVVADHFPDLIEAVATALASDPEKAEALRGSPGPEPDLGEVIGGLYYFGIVEAVSDSLWETRHQELAAMPETIANVAEEVYRIYGNELRGKDGETVPAEDVAAALAVDPGFVALLDLELAKTDGSR